jgi:hypothetical protein
MSRAVLVEVGKARDRKVGPTVPMLSRRDLAVDDVVEFELALVTLPHHVARAVGIEVSPPPEG